jgi:hypothetical protein
MFSRPGANGTGRQQPLLNESDDEDNADAFKHIQDDAELLIEQQQQAIIRDVKDHGHDVGMAVSFFYYYCFSYYYN